MIKFRAVSKHFGEGAPALVDIDLEIAAQQTTFLIGPSGCGKSTLLRLIIGLLEPTSGDVEVAERKVSRADLLELRRRIGYVIQDGGLFPHLTARENITLMAQHLRSPASEIEARLRELCELTRFASQNLDRYPVELSGGQRQRVSLMRALMLKPELLLLDDRTAGAGATATARKIAHWTAQHLTLVGISLAVAIVAGIPLGIVASRPGALGHFILGSASMVQTIPALALLALLVPVPGLGISPTTAIVALFLYSLLPIIRNTAAGLQDISLPLRESAAALGLEPGAQLRKIFLPIASRTILAGIKTSAVINVGSATLAALIGAGGLGEPIISGLNLNDHATILQGAIPAALLALLVQLLFDGLDRVFVPKGLRLKQ